MKAHREKWTPLRVIESEYVFKLLDMRQHFKGCGTETTGLQNGVFLDIRDSSRFLHLTFNKDLLLT